MSPGGFVKAPSGVETAARTPQSGRNALARWRPSFGAIPDAGGVTFRVWASAARSITLQIESRDHEAIQRVPLQRGREGLFEAQVDRAGDGTLYRYAIDGRGPYPDPASRFQPDGVHGPSEVIDWTRYTWSDDAWRGVPLEQMIVYELHVGTFSRSGDFAGIVERLPWLVDLGVTAIELMPVAAFAGRRNWGYDGAALFSPAWSYGRPSDLQRLVDAAHRAGLAVLLDVVYNHLGPDGAYLALFAPQFFSPHHKSPWGDGVNLDTAGSDMVRRFLIEDALHWIVEYHLDGLRLDATHALADDSPRHFLAELSAEVHAAGVGRPVHVIAEDERNLATIVRPPRTGGWGLDAVWADDFHHEVHRLLTGEGEGYYLDYSGRGADIAATIDDGWFYRGQVSKYTGEPKGSDTTDIDRHRFVFCLQNHDQMGNRAFGERLHHLVGDLAACRAAAALLILAPETPLLFMGEEWAASTPFLYFTDHHDELGRQVTEGRRREFGRFAAFGDPAVRDRIPDPQDPATFDASRLNWDETAREPHASMARLYRALIGLRPLEAGVVGSVDAAKAWAADEATVCMDRFAGSGRMLIVARLKGAGRVTVPAGGRAAERGCGAGLQPCVSPGDWQVALTTEEQRFAPDARAPQVTFTDAVITIDFARPSAVVLIR